MSKSVSHFDTKFYHPEFLVKKSKKIFGKDQPVACHSGVRKDPSRDN